MPVDVGKKRIAVHILKDSSIQPFQVSLVSLHFRLSLLCGLRCPWYLRLRAVGPPAQPSGLRYVWYPCPQAAAACDAMTLVDEVAKKRRHPQETEDLDGGGFYMLLLHNSVTGLPQIAVDSRKDQRLVH